MRAVANTGNTTTYPGKKECLFIKKTANSIINAANIDNCFLYLMFIFLISIIATKEPKINSQILPNGR